MENVGLLMLFFDFCLSLYYYYPRKLQEYMIRSTNETITTSVIY
jgi:hypothetical protein